MAGLSCEQSSNLAGIPKLVDQRLRLFDLGLKKELLDFKSVTFKQARAKEGLICDLHIPTYRWSKFNLVHCLEVLQVYFSTCTVGAFLQSCRYALWVKKVNDNPTR